MIETTSPRKYSLDEIDRLRTAIQIREIPHPNPYGANDVTQWRLQVDNRIRFYMQSSIEPNELEKKPVLFPDGYAR